MRGPEATILAGRRPRSLPIEIDRVTAALSIVGYVFHLFRGPITEFEVVRNDARPLLQLAVEQRLDLGVHCLRQQIDGYDVGRTVALLEEVALDDVGGLFET